MVDSDRCEENYELISSSQCIIFNEISFPKNTVFSVKLVPWRCQSQPYVKKNEKKNEKMEREDDSGLGTEPRTDPENLP